MRALVLASVVARVSGGAFFPPRDPPDYSTIRPRAEKLWVHIVPHTHDDVGWLKNVDQYFSGANNTIQHAGVRNILNSVVDSLSKNPDRTFTYVEQAFFQRWWRELSETQRATAKKLVDNDQLSFVNGGWCMHDEAATHYVDMIDQTTLGHRLLKEQFGDKGIPRVGWQLDPFGHSATQAALLSAEVGFEALFFGRIDYQDLKKRVNESRAEWIWQASPSLGPDAQVFAGLTGSYGGNYGPPPGFDYNWDAEPVEENMDLTSFNVPSRVEDFVKFALWQGAHTKGNHIMWTMGSDFHYENAEAWFVNLDKLIKHVNLDGRVGALYSSPQQYAAAKYDESQRGIVTWSVESGDNCDLFPYADGPHMFWTGYFTSRPSLKRYVRFESGYYGAVRQAQSLALSKGSSRAGGLETLAKLEEALSVAQHHDAVSGTAKQHVAFDYAMRIARGHEQARGVLSTSLDAFLLGNDAANSNWQECLRLNETVCTLSQTPNSDLTIAVWNQLAQAREELVLLPIHSAAVTLRDGAGASVPFQILPVSETVTSYRRHTNEAAWVCAFQAVLPPLGVSVYKITTGAMEKTPDESFSQMVRRSGPGDSVIENDYIRLTFSSSTGLLISMVNKKTNTAISVSQDFCFYTSNIGDGASGQHSGAYIFRPKTGTTCDRVSPSGATLTVVGRPGDLVQEVRQVFGNSNVSQTVRLVQGERFATFEWTTHIDKIDPKSNQTEAQCVSWRQTGGCDPDGPREPNNDKPCNVSVHGDWSGYCECFNGRRAQKVRCGHQSFTCYDACQYYIGKEVVSKFTTNIANREGELLVDSNGREMLRRRRNFRPFWNLEQTEQVAGNYFPINSAAAIRDANAQLTVLVDRAQGVGSIVDGEIELMIHRRVVEDDARGVGEPLDETQTVGPYVDGRGGEKSGPSLVVRGRHVVSLEPPARAAQVWRPLTDRVFATPQLAFARVVQSLPRSISALNAELPANVQIMTLQTLSVSPPTLLLRLSHQFGMGEDVDLSKSVSVNLSTLFRGFTIKDAKEVSLTGVWDKTALLARRARNVQWSRGTNPHAWRNASFDFSQSPVVSLGPLEIKTFVLQL